MELYLRIALGLLAFIGYLQAHPTTARKCHSLPVEDLKLDSLKNIKCNQTFAVPTLGLDPGCHGAAMEHFLKEMLHARGNCTEVEDNVSHILEFLDHYNETCFPNSQCHLTTNQEPLENLLTAVKNLVEEINSPH